MRYYGGEVHCPRCYTSKGTSGGEGRHDTREQAHTGDMAALIGAAVRETLKAASETTQDTTVKDSKLAAILATTIQPLQMKGGLIQTHGDIHEMHLVSWNNAAYCCNREGDPHGGTRYSACLKHIRDNPFETLESHMEAVELMNGPTDALLWLGVFRALATANAWQLVPDDIKESRSPLRIYHWLINLNPECPEAKRKKLRGKIYGARLTPFTQLGQLTNGLTKWWNWTTQAEQLGMVLNNEELLDTLQELVKPVLNKNNGETGTDLAQDLHSGRAAKRIRLGHPMAQLTLGEYLAVCQNFGRTLPPDTPMSHAFVVTTENPKGGDKGDKTPGKGGGKGGRGGDSKHWSQTVGTINGRTDSQCIQHVFKLGGCDRRSKNCEGDVKDKMHDPKRLNQGILPEEVATWQECWKHKTGKCDYNVNECKFKHGDGTAQLAWKKTQLAKQQRGGVPLGAKANMSTSRDAGEEDGESIHFQIWHELKALREDRAAAQEDRARERQDRDADRALGLAHMQLAIEDAPRGARRVPLNRPCTFLCSLFCGRSRPAPFV